MERKYLATILLGGDLGRGILVAEKQNNLDYGSRWHIIAILPDGTEEDTEISTAWGGTLVDAVKIIHDGWGRDGADVWGLEWLPSDDEMARMCE